MVKEMGVPLINPITPIDGATSKQEENSVDVDSLSVREILKGIRNGSLKNLDSSVANRIIDYGQTESIFGFSRRQKKGEVKGYPESFSSFDETTLDKLIGLEETGIIVHYLDKFKIDHKQIGYKLIDRGYLHTVLKDLDLFSIDKKEFVKRIFDSAQSDRSVWAGGEFIVDNLNKLEDIDKNELANNLIDKGLGDKVLLKNLNKFDNIDYTEIAKKLIEKGEGQVIAENLDKFKDLDASVVDKLSEFEKTNNTRVVYKVATNILSFKASQNNEIANKLIDQLEGRVVADNLEKFQGLNYIEIADKLIKASRINGCVARNLEKFQGIDHIEIAHQIIDSGNGTDVVGNLEKFKGIDHIEIANRILDSKYANAIGYNLAKFKGLNEEIADRITNQGYYHEIPKNLGSFKNLSPEFADDLIEGSYGDKIASNLESFKNLSSETLEYLKTCLKKHDSRNVYLLRDKYPLEEIVKNYDYFRVKYWEEGHNALEDDDKKFFEKLKEFIPEETLGKLWQNITKEELHIIAPEIIKMFQISKYSEDTFRGEYLEKIIKDGARYGEQQIEPLRHFHQIIQSIYEPELEKDMSSVFAEATSFEQTKALAEQLKQQGPFKNWETLRKYYELSEVLKQREVLEKLQKLKDNGKDKQYKFFTDLAFHPGSKIPMQTVFKFMEDPARFLDVGDVHASEAHERKKPSNYTQFAYLDIRGEDLRDALIEGNLDKLQYFKPFEAGYKIANTNYENKEITSQLKDALGSFKEGIKGTAKNPGKLFKETKEILKKYNLEYAQIIDNPELLQGELHSDLEKLLFDNNFGIKDKRKFDEYLVKIHPKSAPEGHLAGNDTACCMPFGSGKNNVYMYNLGCSILTVQRKVGDKYRTIAQSVLTPDVDIKHNISELVKNVQNEALLSNIIQEDLTQKKNIIITADNIEVAPNADIYKSAIEKIYSDFVSRYAHDMDSKDIEKDRMLIGQGYSDLNFTKAKAVDNTYIPITPVAYSDNYGQKVYELPLNEKSEIVPIPSYGKMQKLETEKADPDLPKGVSYLTAHDTLRVSYMEGKVYAENESLVQYIHRIGNELTAKDINNSFKGRPNLSLKVEDESGAMLGYMIAYEGAEKESRNKSGEKLIYISDLASDTAKSKLAGGRLIKAFEALVKREYLDKNNPLPIVAQAREKTSYKLIQDHLNELGTAYGYKYELEENGSYESGGDTMYQVKLIPVKI